jgi:secretion/DNA translocation related CpaE-like protein
MRFRDFEQRPPAQVILVAAEGETRRAVQGLAAAVGVQLLTVPHPGDRGPAWRTADLILVEADLAAEFRDRARRPDLVMVTVRSADEVDWAAALQAGADRVVLLPEGEEWLSHRLADAAQGGARRALVVGFVGGRGGAGSSVLAAAFARCVARRGLECLLMDGDPLGGGLDLVLGAEDVPGLRWPELAQARGLLPTDVLPLGLPRVDGVWLLSWDRAPLGEGVPVNGDETGAGATWVTFEAVLSAARRRVDVVVVDLARWAVDALVGPSWDAVHVVVTADVLSVAAAAKVVDGLAAAGAPTRLVVRGPAPGKLRAESAAAALGLPLAGFLRAEPGLGASLERREPPGLRLRGPLSVFSDRLLTELLRNREADDLDRAG